MIDVLEVLERLVLAGGLLLGLVLVVVGVVVAIGHVRLWWWRRRWGRELR